MTNQTTTLPKITEKAFQAQVVQLAKSLGWLCYHTWNSIHSAKGFPDLVLVKGEQVIFAELKSETGKVSPEQEAWLEALTLAGQKVYTWRPRHWDHIVRVLSDGRMIAKGAR